MKKRFYIKTAFLSLTFMALLSSCLKDSKYYINFAASKPLVELPGSTGIGPLGGPFQTFAFAISSTPTPLDVAVNLAAPKPLGSPLTVKLSVNPDTLTKYNAANSTNYTLLPAADYSSTLTVTIPAGQNLVALVVNINTSLIDPSQQYVLPLTITSGGGQQISNYNTILYNIQVKNAYDDNYTATGYVFHPSVPRAINATYAVTTQGAIRCQAPVADLGADGDFFDFDVQPAVAGTSVINNWAPAGNTDPLPESGFMTLDNPGGVTYAPATGGGGLPGGATYNSTIYNNTYNVSTKTFWMHFGYGSGASSQAGYTRQFYMELVAQ